MTATPVPASPFDKKCPYPPDTPEWHLYTHMQGLLSLERSYTEDSNRFLRMAEEKREKAEHYRLALDKLTAGQT